MSVLVLKGENASKNSIVPQGDLWASSLLILSVLFLVEPEFEGRAGALRSVEALGKDLNSKLFDPEV